jgi:hypothetical protein
MNASASLRIGTVQAAAGFAALIQAGNVGSSTGAAASVGGPEQVQSAPLQQGSEEGGRSRAGSVSGFGLGDGLGDARRGSGHSLDASTGEFPCE